MTDNIPQEDHRYYCKELADTLRYYISMATDVPRQQVVDALTLLNDYVEFEAAGRPKPLKNSIRDAMLSCLIDGEDPVRAALVAIANRSGDAAQHFRDDTEIMEDIRNWLLHEADQPEIG